MNETEYISDVSSPETSLFYNQIEKYSPSVTEVTETEFLSITDVVEFTETAPVSSANYDIYHIQQNTDGILLMVTGIFFLLVISGISKIVGHFLSM